jgi:hypothetical protein
MDHFLGGRSLTEALPSDFVEIAFRYEYRNGPNKTAGKQADGCQLGAIYIAGGGFKFL